MCWSARALDQSIRLLLQQLGLCSSLCVEGVGGLGGLEELTCTEDPHMLLGGTRHRSHNQINALRSNSRISGKGTRYAPAPFFERFVKQQPTTRHSPTPTHNLLAHEPPARPAPPCPARPFVSSSQSVELRRAFRWQPVPPQPGPR